MRQYTRTDCFAVAHQDLRVRATMEADPKSCLLGDQWANAATHYCAYAVFAALLFFGGIKMVIDGFKVAGESVIGGLMRFTVAFILFFVMTPVLFFCVLGFAAP